MIDLIQKYDILFESLSYITICYADAVLEKLPLNFLISFIRILNVAGADQQERETRNAKDHIRARLTQLVSFI